MVVPVSTKSTTASAKPNPHAASTDPETYLMPVSDHMELEPDHMKCIH